LPILRQINEIVRWKGWLCAMDSIYTRSKTVMRDETYLYALKNSELVPVK